MIYKTDRFFRPALAANKLGVSVATLWRYAREIPEFPKPLKLSARVTVFSETSLDEYVAQLRKAA